MMRKLIWITAALLHGSAALAQGPAKPAQEAIYGNPGSYGYPGYGAFPYGMPPGQSMSRPLPYGQPPRMEIPLPFAQPGPAPLPYGTIPTFAQPAPWSAPMPMPTEKGKGQLPDAAPPKHRPAEPELIYEGIAMETPVESEPYTLYEGHRYDAAIKHDNTSVWAQASFLHWWFRGVRTPPLVATTTGALVPASIAPDEFTGVQASVGEWLDREHYTAVEVAGFWLGRHHSDYTFRTDAAGSPPLGAAILAPNDASTAILGPGVGSGVISVQNVMDMHGVELNMIQNVIRVNRWTFDHFVGARYIYLRDRLTMDQTATALADGALFFNGAPLPAGSSVGINDVFSASNRFYGGQIGARLSWTWCNFEIGAVAKIGFGATRHVVTIDGSSTSFATSERVAGGLLAQPSNSGRFGSTDFSVVPEVAGTVSWQALPRVRLMAGYSYLHWTRVQRAGGQIDRVNPAAPPTSPTFAAGAGGNPLFPNARTDFWAHGLNLGVEFKY